ncbi:MAG: ATP-binding cassette domain-containing protein [Acidobacteriota bacterium]|nr:ATP-binding cassette domain-containing protein [Acidobacteriota bacterium]
MSRALAPVAALALAGPLLLVVAPTRPPRPPVAALLGVALGIAVGASLFVALAGALPRPVFTRAAGVVALVGMSEEAIWRGFALARIAPVAGAVSAVVVTSAAFASTHVPLLGGRGASVHVVTGGTFGLLFLASGSLLACAVAHATYNLAAVAGRGSPACAAIALRSATKSYGGHRALGPLDLTIAPGELVALLGPNGAGKTTLVSLCAGLRRPTAGSVRVFGSDPREWRARRRIGTTPQQMDFPPTLRGREILDLARLHAPDPLPFDELVWRFGLADVIRPQNGALSGGERRRLALALAFATRPDLVLLDEPTTGLDVESRRGAWDAIRSFGGTVLFTTHHLEEAHALAGRVVVLHRGAVVADGHIESEEELLRLTR